MSNPASVPPPDSPGWTGMVPCTGCGGAPTRRDCNRCAVCIAKLEKEASGHSGDASTPEQPNHQEVTSALAEASETPPSPESVSNEAGVGGVVPKLQLADWGPIAMSEDEVRELLGICLHGPLPQHTVQRMLLTLALWLEDRDGAA